MNKCHKKSYIFLRNNACETPYIDIYVDFLSTTFIYSVLLHGASDREIFTSPHSQQTF